MKIVHEEKRLENLFLTAKLKQEIFGNDELYIEKYFQHPRHRSPIIQRNHSSFTKGLFCTKKTSEINRRKQVQC